MHGRHRPPPSPAPACQPRLHRCVDAARAPHRSRRRRCPASPPPRAPQPACRGTCPLQLLEPPVGVVVVAPSLLDAGPYRIWPPAGRSAPPRCLVLRCRGLRPSSPPWPRGRSGMTRSLAPAFPITRSRGPEPARSWPAIAPWSSSLLPAPAGPARPRPSPPQLPPSSWARPTLATLGRASPICGREHDLLFRARCC